MKAMHAMTVVSAVALVVSGCVRIGYEPATLGNIDASLDADGSGTPDLAGSDGAGETGSGDGQSDGLASDADGAAGDVAPEDGGGPDGVVGDADTKDGGVIGDAVQQDSVGPDGVIGDSVMQDGIGPDGVIGDAVGQDGVGPDGVIGDAVGQDGGCVSAMQCDQPTGVCMVAACVGGGCLTQQAEDGALCDDDDACTYADRCFGGECVGVPLVCQEADPCLESQCVAGECVPEAISCDDGNPCTDDLCESGVGCKHAAVGCDDGIACTEDYCNADGECRHAPLDCQCGEGKPCPPATRPCAAMVCLDGGCVEEDALDGTPCDDGDGCTTGESCQGGSCGGGEPVVCQAPDLCTDADCVAGACRFTAAVCDDDDPCTVDSCDPATGKCEHTSVECPDEDGLACTVEHCDSQAGGCAIDASGCECYQDSAGCAQTDVPCREVACVDTVCQLVVSADASGCDDGDPCTEGDACFQGSCRGQPKTCPDTGDACLESACVEGKCIESAVVCDDSDPCTVDSCDSGAAGCVFEPKACDDGLKCTTDSCVAGACQHTATACDDGNPCTIDACDPATGLCAATPRECANDTNLCTVSVCNAETGLCEPRPAEAPAEGQDQCCSADGDCTGALGACQDWSCLDFRCVKVVAQDGRGCDDGDPCTIQDLCAGGACNGEPMVCPPAGPCTVGYCTGGACDVKPRDCDDGDPCTVDVCADGTAGNSEICLHDPKCDDGIACTLDVCDPDTGACSIDPANCECTINAQCQGKLGDLGPCEREVCDGGTCAIGKAAPLTLCDDGDACTHLDHCSLEGVCAGNAIDCNDGDLCTLDSCDPAIGCMNEPRPCDDGLWCTADSCDPQTGKCMFSSICPDTDGLTCTVETCVPDGLCAIVSDTCECWEDTDCGPAYDPENPPSSCMHLTCQNGSCGPAAYAPGTLCNDGDPCTLGDACDGLVCTGAPMVCQGDGNPCRDWFCQAGACSWEPASCDDGSACTLDGCDEIFGCTYFDAVCDDGDECTVNWCYEDTGCNYDTPVGCDDRIPCTLDSCDTSVGCVNDIEPCLCTNGEDCAAPGRCYDNVVCEWDSAMGAQVCQYLGGPDCAVPPGSCIDGYCDAQTGDCVQEQSELGSFCENGAGHPGVCDPWGQCSDPPPGSANPF